MGARTDTRRLGVVDGIPLVARRAFRGAVGGATDPGLRHAIVACATFRCENKPHIPYINKIIVARTSREQPAVTGTGLNQKKHTKEEKEQGAGFALLRHGAI